MIKRQTVWLLTMLSLMIVLSVYYMLSDKGEQAYIQEPDANLEQTNLPSESTEGDVEVNEIRSVGGNELFTTIRMEIEDKRSMKKERLREVISANNVSANEINEALNEIDYLENIESKETILQENILSTDKNYEDVLVRTDDNKVHVHVITDDLPPEAAVHIMQMVRDETGINDVEVNFQPVNS